MLERFFTPDYMLRSFRELSPSFMECTEKKTVIADIDGAVASPDEASPSPGLLGWVRALRTRGIDVALISESDPRRLRHFSTVLGIPAFHIAGGAKYSVMLRVMKKLGSHPGNTVAVGSRLLSDVPAARRAGVTSVAVRPIGGNLYRRGRLERIIESYYKRLYSEKKNRGFSDEDY